MKLSKFLEEVTVNAKTFRILVNRNGEKWEHKDRPPTTTFHCELKITREKIKPKHLEKYLDFELVRVNSKIHNVLELWVKGDNK